MGGGVLPASIVNGEPVFLFSREAVARGYRDSGKWSDFGGSKERNETPRETAVREGAEEAAGLLGDKSDVSKLVQNQLAAKIEVAHYTSYVVYVPYWKEFPEEFRKIYKEATTKQPELVDARNGLFEKDYAQWVPLSALRDKRVRDTFRPWYVRSGMLRQLQKQNWTALRDQDRIHKQRTVRSRRR